MHHNLGFPHGSAGKESACNVGDLGSIPGLGRFPGEGKDYPLQYSGLENSMDFWVHGVAKSWIWLSDFHMHHYWEFPGSSVAKNLPASAGNGGEWVRSLDRDDPPEKGMASHCSILAWRIPWTEEPGGLQSMGSQRFGHNRSDLACTHTCINILKCLWPIAFKVTKEMLTSSVPKWSR